MSYKSKGKEKVVLKTWLHKGICIERQDSEGAERAVLGDGSRWRVLLVSLSGLLPGHLHLAACGAC